METSLARTIFVTGGAGYVGSHCCKAFASAGWEVVTYDNLSRGWRDFVRWGPLIEGDILDAPALSRAVADARPSVVAHFAALAYVGESVADPGGYFRTNVVGTLNLLDAMRAAGPNALVFSSTCATYGVPGVIPIEEGHPQSPINPYGRSKLMLERLLADHDRAYGVRSVVLRYFNAAGADPDGEIGERHEPETHVIPLALRGALDDGFTFDIYGADYPTRDGTAVRDYVHVCDLADAHLKAVDHLAAGGASETFNLGTGSGVTVREIAQAVERVCGRRLKLRVAARRQGDPPVLIASPAKAEELLGWTPSRSAIDDIVRDAWRWHLRDEGSAATGATTRLGQE